MREIKKLKKKNKNNHSGTASAPARAYFCCERRLTLGRDTERIMLSAGVSQCKTMLGRKRCGRLSKFSNGERSRKGCLLRIAEFRPSKLKTAFRTGGYLGLLGLLEL